MQGWLLGAGQALAGSWWGLGKPGEPGEQSSWTAVISTPTPACAPVPLYCPLQVVLVSNVASK